MEKCNRGPYSTDLLAEKLPAFGRVCPWYSEVLVAQGFAIQIIGPLRLARQQTKLICVQFAFVPRFQPLEQLSCIACLPRFSPYGPLHCWPMSECRPYSRIIWCSSKARRIASGAGPTRVRT